MVTLRFRQRDLYPAPGWPDMTAEAWRKLIEADRPGVPGGVMERRAVSERRGERSGTTEAQRLFAEMGATGHAERLAGELAR